MDTDNAPGKIRVLICHDVRVLREGLACLLLNWPELAIVETPEQNGGQAHLGTEITADIVLLDTGCKTVELAERIQLTKIKFPGAKVIVVGETEATNDILANIEAGASACTFLDSSPQHLVDTIRLAYLGEVICPPQISALLFERVASLKRQLAPSQDNLLGQLTPRELEILQRVSAGMSNKEIAADLTLELQTVKNHVHKILEKLRVQNRRDAAEYARSASFAEPVPR